MKYENIDALNWSSLVAMAESPLLYQWRQEHPREDTPALSFGRAVHCSILEPEAFHDQYIVRPAGIDLRTKAGKEWRADIGDREVLTTEQGEIIDRMVCSVGSHPDAVALLADTQRELAVRWQLRGVDCKARADAVKRSALIDLKTCRGLRWFERDAATYRYHGQMAWYRDGCVEAEILSPDAETYMIAVETSEPYDCAVFRVPEYALHAGRELYEKLFSTLLECQRTGLWPGRFPSITDLDLPRWADGLDEEGF